MASPEQEFGDVIDLSSSDEITPRRKRSFHDSVSDHSVDSVYHRSKRVKSRSSSAKPVDAQAAEEGELVGDGNSATGLDTSSRPAEADSAATTNDPQNNPDQPAEKSKAAVFAPGQATVYSHRGINVELPAFNLDSDFRTWDHRFEDWVEVFCARNAPYSVAAGIVLQAYYYYLENGSGLAKKKKARARAAAKTASDRGTLKHMLIRGWGKKPNIAELSKPMSDTMATADNETIDLSKPPPKHKATAAHETIDLVSESDEEYEPQFTHATRQRPDANPIDAVNPHSGQAAGNAAASADDVVDDVTAQLQRRYFPSAANPGRMCLYCGREGHGATACSSVACRFCTSHDHSEYCCPTRERCKKCRQLGHAASSCVEKLALTKEEGLACSYCDSPDHLEDTCTAMWRSFVPDEDTIIRVTNIVPSCSLCGTTQHYSSDCGENRNGTKNPTWTVANRDQYLDPKSKAMCIEAEAAAKQKSKLAGKGAELFIRGHAARKGNVVYSESEDSEGDFLGNKPVRKQGPGQIRMASNIQMPSNPNNGRPPPPPGQPPLPRGPPPAGPPPGYDNYGRAPPPNFQENRPLPPPQGGHALPSKPPPGKGAPTPWQNDSRNASDSSRGGRGGRGVRGGRGARGGRGRGRGRGGGK